MTEVPEHLLKRSRERRAAIGGGGEEAGEPAAAPAEPAEPTEPAAATPATTEPAAAAAPATPAPPPPPEPVRPEVEAYHSRRRIPYWVVPVLAFLPIWAYFFQATLEPREVELDPGLALGEEVFLGCSACHGAGGQGVGAFPALDEVLEDFPDYRDHMMWVRLGTSGWPAGTYTVTGKQTGAAGVMPGHPQLSDQELAAVTLYERVSFGGLSPEDEEELVQIAEGETTFAEAGLGEHSQESGVPESALQGG